MADSDIENFISDCGFSPQVGASTQGPVRDLKSLLSIARQDRAPLESSNASNWLQRSNQVLHAASTKSREESNGSTAVGQYSRVSINSGRPYEECTDVDSGQRRWGMPSARLDEDDGTYSPFHERASELGFDRQTVEAVRDSFRELCAPKRKLEDSNFFEEIIDVDREVGFGEDEEFVGHQNDSSNASRCTLETHHSASYGERISEEGSEEGHIPREIELSDWNNDVRASREQLEEFLRDSDRESARSCSTTASGRERSGRLEQYMRYPSPQDPQFRRSLSNQSLQLTAREDTVDGPLKPEKLKRAGGSSVDDLDEQGDKEWLPMQFESGEEGIHLQHSDGEWETESREARSLGRERSSSDVGLHYSFEKNPENMDEVVRDMLTEMRQENGVRESEESLQDEPARTSLVLAAIGKQGTDENGTPYSLIIMGFEDLLREADGRADREKETVEDLVRIKDETEEAMLQQQKLWSETEEHLESRINSLDMQHSRLSDLLRETAAALAVEKERRKESRREVDRILEMLKNERKSHQETLEKLSTCVNSLMKVRGNLAMQKSRSAEDGGPSYLQVVETVLRDMDRELQINLTHLTRKSSEVDYHSSDIDEVSRWKKQRDALEAERDEVEEKMTSLLREARESHEEMEVVWLERETLLAQTVGCLEVELQHSKMKQGRKDAEIVAEGQRWAEELEKRRKAWAEERTAWEAAVRERDERLGAIGESMRRASEGNCRVIVPLEDSSAVSDVDFKEMDKMRNRCRGPQDVARQSRRPSYNHEATVDDKINQFCVDVGNLALGMEAGVEKATEDIRSRERQWQIERMKWKQEEASFKKERQEMEKRVSNTVALVEELKGEMNAKEAEMEAERKQIQALLLEKATEVERLNVQLKSKEHDMEITVQKFMDEVRLIDKEVEKERKEREQVMELHFASKRKVVTDMKEREEKWEREIESMNQELDNARRDIRHKEKEIEELRRLSLRAPSERERQLTKAVSGLQHEKDALAAELAKEKGEVRRAMEDMLVDVWKVCEEERIQAAVAKRLGPGEELRLQKPMWDSLWLENSKNKGISGVIKSIEWEAAVGKIARLEKEVSEASTAMETLRDELKVKEDQLLEAKAERERESEEREKDWSEDREQVMELLEGQRQKERELAAEWQVREEELVKEKEDMEKSHKVEQEESAETISNLQGVVRELEWVLKQTKSPQTNHECEHSIIKRSLKPSASKNAELVKVHASYLEEVDRYILELEAKMEVSERNLRTPGGGSTGRDRKWGGDPDMNLALLKIERELFSSPKSKGHINSKPADDDRGSFPTQGSRDWDVAESGLAGASKQMARKRAPRPLERNMCLTLNGLATLAKDRWADGADEHLPLWQLEDHRNSFNSITSWMSPRSSTEDLYSSHELPARGALALPTISPITPLRRQQKWMVDVSWLEQVRKEHAWLRQQLEIERQRVAALGRVEADNRWIEAAIIRALELKRESDSKVADMKRKVNVMEVLMSKKNPMCTSP